MVNSNGISFSGLASGLDTRSIINQLVALERIPIQLIEAKRSSAQERLGKIGVLEGLVRSLKTAAESLSTGSDFFAYTVSNTDESTRLPNRKKKLIALLATERVRIYLRCSCDCVLHK